MAKRKTPVQRVRMRSPKGVRVTVSADQVEAYQRRGYEASSTPVVPAADESPSAAGYSTMKVADLKAEAERRNEGREDADRLPVEGKKADLVAALEADDAAADE